MRRDYRRDCYRDYCSTAFAGTFFGFAEVGCQAIGIYDRVKTVTHLNDDGALMILMVRIFWECVTYLRLDNACRYQDKQWEFATFAGAHL